jgi:serine/threonine protein kinase
MTDAETLFNKHFEWLFEEEALESSDPGSVDWEEFRRDLQRCPEIAFHKGGDFRMCALQFALIAPGVTLEIVEELLEVNPKAMNEYAGRYQWDTINWVRVHHQLYNLSPEVLRVLLERRPEFIAHETTDVDMMTEAPFSDYIDCGVTEYTEVIFETSPHAVALALAFHFLGREAMVCDEVLTLALDRALTLEREGRGIFTMSVTHSSHEDFCLLRVLFRDLKPANSELCDRYLRVLIEGREARLQDTGLNSANDSDQLSLSACTEIALEHMDFGTLWEEYLRKFLVPTLVHHLNQRNSSFLRHHLQDFVRSRHAYPQRKRWDLAEGADDSSLTCCVLYLFAELYHPRKDPDEDDPSEKLWQLYLEKYGDDVTKRMKDGSHVISAAIRMGHSWDPILRGIVKKDHSALETRDVAHKLPPFMLAALRSKNKTKKDVAISNIYELLRANPAVLVLYPPFHAEAIARVRDEDSELQPEKRRKAK